MAGELSQQGKGPQVVRGARQLKVGLRVRDFEASCALYLKLGFRQIPWPDEPRRGT
jgi:hypothetical protein